MIPMSRRSHVNLTMLLLLAMAMTLLSVRQSMPLQRYEFMNDCFCGVEPISRLIHGGKRAVPSHRQWMALLTFVGIEGFPVSLCAGSLINDRFVLTAAHCVEPPEVRVLRAKDGLQLRVWVGEGISLESVKLSDSLKIRRIITHPNYRRDQETGMTDVALIELETPLNFTAFFSPVCLPDFSDFDNLSVAGWGYTGNNSLPESLMEAELQVVPDHSCRRTYPNLTEHEMCAGNEFANVCHGDSGGPLISRRGGLAYQAGIVTAGTAVNEADCGHTKNPAIFERVTSHLPWIWEQTAEAKWCINLSESLDLINNP